MHTCVIPDVSGSVFILKEYIMMIQKSVRFINMINITILCSFALRGPSVWATMHVIGVWDYFLLVSAIQGDVCFLEFTVDHKL